MEDFTKEEIEVLRPFFTNIDQPIFVLINLPEVVKGALFSRYSRSTKSLRRVLLDEFIMKPEMGFKDIIGQTIKSSKEEQIVAIKKAEEFYDRVLVGYGDDSVAELGGANIACEQVSQIAAKFIEATRIGISPLEKSTRYVWFNQKINGQYQYVREPTLINSKHANLYLKTCDFLFDSYSNLISPMTKFITEKFPREDGITERAYNSSIRAKVCDVLRGLLPASTMTNVGLYGNGRAFEYLLLKMYSSPLMEIKQLSKSMNQELSKVVPSFVKRSNDSYGKTTQQYISETYNATREFVRGIEQSSEQTEEVTLVEYDDCAEEKVLQAIIYPHSTMPLIQIKNSVRYMSEAQKKELIKEYLSRRLNRRHKPGRALEHVYYTFDILANYGAYRDLQRHRLLTQEPQDLSVKHGYSIPKEIIDAGFEKEYRDCMSEVKNSFQIISKDYPKEAQYIVALGYKIRWYIKMNLRELCHLTELRSMQQGHPDYRSIAQKVYLKAKEVHPLLTEYIRFVDMNEYDMERLEAEKKIDKKMEEIDKKYNADARI